MGARGRSAGGMEVAGVCQEMTSEIWLCIIMAAGPFSSRGEAKHFIKHTAQEILASKLIFLPPFYQSAQLNGLIDGLDGQ